MDELEELELLNAQVFDDAASPAHESENSVKPQDKPVDTVISKNTNDEIPTEKNKKTKVTVTQLYQELQELKKLMVSSEDVSKKVAEQINHEAITQKISALLAEKVTLEKLSFTFLLGVCSIIVAFIFGVSYGYILAVAKYPYWMNKNIFYSLLNTPSGLMIFSIGGIFLFYIGKVYRMKILRWLAVVFIIVSFVFPFIWIVK